MKFYELTDVKWLRLLNVQGMVLYPFVLFAPQSPSEVLRNHERIHVEQIKRDGVISFYTLYLMEYVVLRLRKMSHDEAYRNISYEWEAYQFHHNPDYRVVAKC